MAPLPENKIRVLHIFSTLPVGGAEMLMLNFVKYFDRERFDFVVCCLGGEGEIGGQVRDYGVEIISFNSERIGNFNTTLLFKLRNFIKAGEFDIVHTHMYHANLYGRAAAWLSGRPIIISSVHNIYKKVKRHRAIINFTLSKITDKVIVGTKAVMEAVKKHDHVSENKMKIIPYGIDTAIFMKNHDGKSNREKLGLSHKDYVVGNVARLEDAKGQRFLIESIKILKNRGLDSKCLIIGSGSLGKNLQDLVNIKGLKDNVFFLGMRHDLPELFSAMDAFIFPSLWEGLPLALLSAMAAGLPVITTHAGGIKDFIVDGEDGIVIPPSDSAAIAKAIEMVLKDIDLKKKLSENARQKVIHDFSAKTMTVKLEETYRQLLSHSRGTMPDSFSISL